MFSVSFIISLNNNDVAKFYRGEQYYLQIDSHSEFVHAWDEKLIKMVKINYCYLSITIEL